MITSVCPSQRVVYRVAGSITTDWDTAFLSTGPVNAILIGSAVRIWPVPGVTMATWEGAWCRALYTPTVRTTAQAAAVASRGDRGQENQLGCDRGEMVRRACAVSFIRRWLRKYGSSGGWTGRDARISSTTSRSAPLGNSSSSSGSRFKADLRFRFQRRQFLAEPLHATVEQQLHRARALAQDLGDLVDLAVLRKLQDERGPLLPGELVDGRPDPATAVPADDLVHHRAAGGAARGGILQLQLAALAPIMIGHCVERDLIEPGRERMSRVRVAIDVAQRFEKHLRS